MKVDPRTPVLVGVGTARRPTDGSAEVEPVDLMVEAALAAASDAGATSMLHRVQMLAVPEGNWSSPDPARLVADRIGATSARTVRVDVGVPQETPIGAALDRIRRGVLDVALVVGGEALASRNRVQRAGGTPIETPQGDAVADEVWSPEGEIMADAEIQAGIWAAVEQYACIDNALRHAEGRTIDEHLDEIARLWAGFNTVAQSNPLAEFAEPRSVEFLRSAGPGNRPLAFPYAKWHSTQWSVDQAGALLLCSAEAARDAGVPLDRWVFPHVAIESSHSLSLTKRDEMHRWQAMGLLGAGAADHVKRPLTDIEHIELYSCFPAAVRVQQRELGLPTDGVPTITGGMAFAGGPLNNFTYQATAAMASRLRENPGDLGLVTTVSGLLTKPGLAVWGAEPPPQPELVADFRAEAAAATPAREVTGSAIGTGRVASYTVTYEAQVPTRAFVIADMDDGLRWIGVSHHAELLARGVTQELIGLDVVVHAKECAPA